jgi:UDP-N-acetylglucosamine:LPS N-acetylglucosamine transferase
LYGACLLLHHVQAGPGTIAEATIRGLPIMLSAYLPGQEEGNIPYVVEGGYGAFSKDPEVIANTVTAWLLDDAKLAELSANAYRAARPHATTAIARDIGKMVSRERQAPALALTLLDPRAVCGHCACSGHT